MKKPAAAKPSRRETNSSELRASMLRLVRRRIVGSGELEFPCVPALLDVYVAQLADFWKALGKPFGDDEMVPLRSALAQALEHGYAASALSVLTIQFKTRPPPQPGIEYTVGVREITMEEHYGDWVQGIESALFGKLPDAKVVSVAATLGDPKAAPVLDVGAGTGRNSLPLARAGHPTTALELVPGMVEGMRAAAGAEGVPLEAIAGDLFSGFSPRRSHYRLIVAAELLSHFRNVEEVRYAYEKFADALVPGGLALVNAFLPLDGYRPDTAAQQISETASARIFDRADLAFITEELPFELVSEESVSAYERENLPSGGWPPTKWFPGWADGRNVFDLPPGRSPVELRWLLHRRR